MSLDAPKTTGIVNIRYVVMSYLNRRNDYSMRNYKRIAQLVIEGFTDLNLFHTTNLEVVYLYMDEAKLVNVPADFVDWLKVGMPINGKLVTVTKDDSILLPRKFTDGKDVGNIDNVDPNTVSYFVSHFKDGKFYGGLYGMRGGYNRAYFRYDAERRQFAFTGEVPLGEIVLEYISTGVSLSSSTAVPRQAVKPLVSWIHWQLAEFDDKVHPNEKERRMRNYYADVEELRTFEFTPTKDEYRDVMYRMMRQTPKRR